MDRTLSPAGVRALLAGSASVALLDVRRRAAFEADPRLIPGAVWRDPDRVGTWSAELAPDVPVIVYCVHGHEVSNGVVRCLLDLGFEAALIEGGIEGWKTGGGSVVAAPPHAGSGGAES